MDRGYKGGPCTIIATFLLAWRCYQKKKLPKNIKHFLIHQIIHLDRINKNEFKFITVIKTIKCLGINDNVEDNYGEILKDLEEMWLEKYAHNWADSKMKRQKFFHKLMHKTPCTSNPNPHENFHELDRLIPRFIFRINKAIILTKKKKGLEGKSY